MEQQRSPGFSPDNIPVKNYFPAFRPALSGHKLTKSDNRTPGYADQISKTSGPKIINPKNRKAISDGYRRSNTSYRPRPIVRPSRQMVDGVADVYQMRTLVPANQDEYLASLAGQPQRLSNRDRREDENDSGNEFGIRIPKQMNGALKNLLRMKRLIPGIAGAVLLLVAVVTFASTHSGKSAEAERPGHISSVETMDDTGTELSERRPTNLQDYKVAESLPRFLRIPGMGQTSRVRRVGVGTETELRMPSNIYDSGWYENSNVPGEAGAVVLTGHASGPTRPGIFHDLKDLKAGDELELETGDGRIYVYEVIKLEAFKDDDPLDPMLVSVVPGTSGLNLITETGRYNEKTNTYDQRLVVYALLVAAPTAADNPVAPNPN